MVVVGTVVIVLTVDMIVVLIVLADAIPAVVMLSAILCDPGTTS